jgi:tellurite resistance protein
VSAAYRGRRLGPVRLTDLIGKKGEGSVHRTDQSDLVIKLYADPTPARAAKLAHMIEAPPQLAQAERERSRLAWPVDVVEDGRGRFAGFLMPEVRGGQELKCVSNERLRRARARGFHWAYLHVAAHNLARIVEAIHARGYVLGDINAGNFLVGPDAGLTAIDTDSFQVPGEPGEPPYLCPVFTPEYTPPEALSRDLTTEPRSEVEDRFGLAVLVHELLFGCHPLLRRAGKGEFDAARQVELGWTPFTIDDEFRVLPSSPPLGIVDEELRELFEACFVAGQADPELRPTAARWAEALRQAAGSLAACAAAEGHWYAPGHGRCPWCVRDKRLGRETFASFPGSQAALQPVLDGFRDVEKGLLLTGVRFSREGQGDASRVSASVGFEVGGYPRSEIRAALYPLTAAGLPMAAPPATPANQRGQLRARAAVRLGSEAGAARRRVTLRLASGVLEDLRPEGQGLPCEVLVYVAGDDPGEFCHARVRETIPASVLDPGRSGRGPEWEAAVARLGLLACLARGDGDQRAAREATRTEVQRLLPRLAAPGAAQTEARRELMAGYDAELRASSGAMRHATALAEALADDRDERERALRVALDVATAWGVLGDRERRILKEAAERMGFEGWLDRHIFGPRSRKDRIRLRVILRLVGRIGLEAGELEETAVGHVQNLLERHLGLEGEEVERALAWMSGTAEARGNVTPLARKARSVVEDAQVRRGVVDCLVAIERSRHTKLGRRRKLRLAQLDDILEPAARRKVKKKPRQAAKASGSKARPPRKAPATSKARAKPKPSLASAPPVASRKAPRPKPAPAPRRSGPATRPRPQFAPHGGVGREVYEGVARLAAGAAVLRRSPKDAMVEHLGEILREEFELSARRDVEDLERFLDWSLDEPGEVGEVAAELHEAVGDHPYVFDRVMLVVLRVMARYNRDRAAGEAWLTEVAEVFELEEELFLEMLRQRRYEFRTAREVLGVAPGCSVGASRRIWKSELRACHPDRVGQRRAPPWVQACAAERAAALNRAWSDLRRGGP